MDDYICVNGEYFDPYFILGVSKDDNLDHISKAFKERARKYHPDKAKKCDVKKYERRFRIIMASYEYIKNKRTEVIKNKPTPDNVDYSQQRVETPVDCSRRYSNIDTYNNDKFELVKHWNEKDFDNKKFNKLFDYTKYVYSKTNPDNDSKQMIIHKTTDGFNGYNSTSIDNCALVSTYNGLMIVGDTLGQGYWSDEYGDYKLSFKGPRNPSKSIAVPKTFEVPENHIKVDINRDFKIKHTKTFKQQQQDLYEKNLNELLSEEQKNKNTVLMYAHQYPKTTINDALAGRLETTQTLLSTLREHYNTIEYAHD